MRQGSRCFSWCVPHCLFLTFSRASDAPAPQKFHDFFRDASDLTVFNHSCARSVLAGLRCSRTTPTRSIQKVTSTSAADLLARIGVSL